MNNNNDLSILTSADQCERIDMIINMQVFLPYRLQFKYKNPLMAA